MEMSEALGILTNYANLDNESISFRMSFLMLPATVELLAELEQKDWQDKVVGLLDAYTLYLENMLVTERIKHEKELKGF
jgi:hypothetical protein